MPKKTKHSPGPWQFFVGSGSHRWIFSAALDKDGRRTLIADCVCPNPDENEVLANCRLIEAAPDLLALCKILVGIRKEMQKLGKGLIAATSTGKAISPDVIKSKLEPWLHATQQAEHLLYLIEGE